jgi:hypothetical protein
MKYPSKYSNGKEVSAAQYITEIICENKARIEKKDLHYRFWTNPTWSKFYRDQIATANKLIQKYPELAIIKALKNKKAEKIFSLRAPHLSTIIDDEAKILENQQQNLPVVEFDRSKEKTFLNHSSNKKSILSKLKELE